jgi:hypothetical protein
MFGAAKDFEPVFEEMVQVRWRGWLHSHQQPVLTVCSKT